MKGRPENDAERMAEPVGQDSNDAADCGGDGDDLLLFHGRSPFLGWVGSGFFR